MRYLGVRAYVSSQVWKYGVWPEGVEDREKDVYRIGTAVFVEWGMEVWQI